jgi:VanZ family protein
LLLAVSSIPGSARPEDHRIFSLFLWLPATVQNLLHVPEYAVLSWLWCRGLTSDGTAQRKGMLRATVLCGGYAVFEELYQLGIPGRYSSLTDLTMDAIGIGMGVLVFCGLRRGIE